MPTPRKAPAAAKRAAAKRPAVPRKTAAPAKAAAKKPAARKTATTPRKRAAAKKPSPLRAVTAADAQKAADAAAAAKAAKPKTISEAADAGTHRELLVATRARIAMAVESVHTPPRDLAALTRRLMEIAREIEAIDAAAKQEADESVELDDEDFDAEAL